MKAIKRGFVRTITAPGVSALVVVGLLLTGPHAAWAKKPSGAPNAVDPTAVTGCGTLSASNTIYALTNNITTTGTGDCIVITGSDDTLDFAGFNVTFTGTAGTNTGAGLDIKSFSDQSVIEGDNATITGFKEGVLDDGSNTTGDDISMQTNQVGLLMTGGTGYWTNFATVSNTAQGVYLKACSDECGVADFFSSGNSGDGVLVTGSDGARVTIFSSVDNGGIGVHLGCTSGCGSNSAVKVGDAPEGFISGSAIEGNAGDGIFLDASESNKQDQVFLINASGNGAIDLHDATNTCGNNHWVHDEYGTAKAGSTSNPVCIPNTPIP